MKLILATLALCSSLNAFGYGVGYSSYPVKKDQKLLSTEVTGITSDGGGMGLQARLVHKFADSIQWEAGVGLGSGERTTRLFAGIDYEVFPDYQNQPKFSVKAGLENASEFGVRRNILGISPTVSKGFEANGKEFFPFFSLPVGISLDGDRNTYKTLANASMGVTGNLPFEEYKNLVGTVEGTFSVKDSYSGFFMGVSYPF